MGKNNVLLGNKNQIIFIPRNSAPSGDPVLHTGLMLHRIEKLACCRLRYTGYDTFS